MSGVLSLTRATMGHAILTVRSEASMAEMWCDGYVLVIRLSQIRPNTPIERAELPTAKIRFDAAFGEMTARAMELRGNTIRDSQDSNAPTVIVRGPVSGYAEYPSVDALNPALAGYGIEILREAEAPIQSDAGASSERKYRPLQVRILDATGETVIVWTEGKERSAQYLVASRVKPSAMSSESDWRLADVPGARPRILYSDVRGGTQDFEPRYALEFLATPLDSADTKSRSS